MFAPTVRTQKKQYTNMKKTYTTPFAAEVEITAVNMIMVATSVRVDKDTEADASESWSNERRGDWGSIWN